MGTLIKFELRKILGNRAGMVACMLMLLMLVGITFLDVFTTETYDLDGNVCSGLEAVEAYRAQQNSHAGVLTDERVASDLAIYDQAADLADTKAPEYKAMRSSQVYETYGYDFWKGTYAVLNDAYYVRLYEVMEDGNRPYEKSLKDGATKDLELAMQERLLNYHEYTDAEKDYWRNKASQVKWPMSYGYADGWKAAFNWSTFLGLAIATLCVAVSSTFAGEYQSGVAAVALPTRLGKRTLPWAKVVAALIFASAYWWVAVVLTLVPVLVLLGADGAELPFQIMGFSNPYPFSMLGATMRCYVLGYVVSLGMTGLTLLLSSQMRTSLPAAIVPMAVILLGVIGLFFTPVAKIAALTPLSTLNWSYGRPVSYAVGPLVLDLPTASVVLYVALLVVCAPLAMRSFRRHQVG